MQCKKCGTSMNGLEVGLWKDKCHVCAARAYKFVISKLQRELEDCHLTIEKLKMNQKPEMKKCILRKKTN